VFIENEQHTDTPVALGVPHGMCPGRRHGIRPAAGWHTSSMSLSLKLWAWLLALFGFLCLSALSSSARNLSTGDQASRHSFAKWESAVFRPAIQNPHFSDIPHFSARPSCQNTRPPEALATPTPQLPAADADERLIVSFIVGTDGKVHSALILQGGDDWTDRLVLQTIRHWRYRPATCNGVPTESEAKVEFSHP
jgi:TonB family protein